MSTSSNERPTEHHNDPRRSSQPDKKHCPSWCKTPAEEHAFEERLGLPLVHLVGHDEYDVAGQPWGFSVERHERADGSWDVLWVGDEVVEVGDAVALARAVVAMFGAEVSA